MKKILFVLCISSLFTACGKEEISKLKNENQQLQNSINIAQQTITQLQQEINGLKETDQYYYQQGIELLAQREYQKAESKFSELIAKFPTSALVTESNIRIQDIKQNREEATKAIKNLPSSLAKISNALEADKFLQDLSEKYNYPDVKEAISEQRVQLQSQINKEKEMQTSLKELGIEISKIRTYWTLDRNVMGGRALVVPYIRFYLKNVGNKPITKLSVSASFELTDKKEILGEGSSYVISSFSDHPLKPGYSKEVFFGSGTGYVSNGYDTYRQYPKINAELFVEVNDGKKKIIKEINIRRKFQY